MFVFRFLLSEMKLLILASVLAFYSLSRYSLSDGFLLKKFINSNKMPYFRDFYFYDFRFKRDEVHEMEKVCCWDFKAETSKNLSHLSYLQRCHVFRFFAVGNETAHSCFCSCFCFLLLFFVEILAIKGISFIVRVMVSHWCFLFLKSYFCLNLPS